jgi:dTDP-4-amino-4,6-dideoxygalactose transaminase
MVMAIPKVAEQCNRYRRPFWPCLNARAGLRAFLQTVPFGPRDIVLLPSYIGWSPREGSGVFDPIAELQLPADFYRMDDQLHVDLAVLEQILQNGRAKVVVLIHYFGWVDPGYPEAIRLARRYGAAVVEDEAHALYSDLLGACGRQGDAVIFSLHKMLPTKTGGLLLIRPGWPGSPEPIRPAAQAWTSPWEYDLQAIAQVRRQNAAELTRLLAGLEDDVQLLWPDVPANVVPQTLPVLIRRVSRDRLYQAMNADGFGVVSLYHTLIPQIQRERFPESNQLSRWIMNLPVHQDVPPGALAAMVEALGRHLRRLADK